MHASILPTRPANLENLIFLMFSCGKSAESEIASGPRASRRRQNFEPEALFKSLIAPTWTRFRPILFLSFPTCISVCILATRPKCCLNYSVNRKNSIIQWVARITRHRAISQLPPLFGFTIFTSQLSPKSSTCLVSHIVKKC